MGDKKTRKKTDSAPGLARAFLAASRDTGGRACATCTSNVVDAVERECRVFNAARKTRRTRAPWGRFHAMLQEQLGYHVRELRSLHKHLKHCRGWEIY